MLKKAGESTGLEFPGTWKLEYCPYRNASSGIHTDLCLCR